MKLLVIRLLWPGEFGIAISYALQVIGMQHLPAKLAGSHVNDQSTTGVERQASSLNETYKCEGLIIQHFSWGKWLKQETD
jgi:hypothetical protein